MRSEFVIDLGALRRNVQALRRAAGRAEVWAVVKADAYGHGALDCARAALEAGAAALCVVTAREALDLRADLSGARLIVLGPTWGGEIAAARDAGLELVVSGAIPEDVPVHVKLDTGMGRWGLAELPALTRNVVGLMTHLATADTDAAFARVQLERFLEATADYPQLTRHVANSAATLALPDSHLDAVRCGLALYGLDPFGDDPARHGLEPVLSWRSEVADVKLLRPGDSTGYGRLFVAEREAWIGIVPVGYADGFRRDLTGARVLVGSEPATVVGTVSMDAFAVLLPGEVAAGTPVTLVGDGILLEEHARIAGTITYELAARLNSAPNRSTRTVVG